MAKQKRWPSSKTIPLGWKKVSHISSSSGVTWIIEQTHEDIWYIPFGKPIPSGYEIIREQVIMHGTTYRCVGKPCK